ncbi:DUF4959 domain-containing protein [Virgibacillus sp. SK37]|uniref:DUF4959 domain-containing protein n=1 Tax=Virgibacillus sp. SK37 TaxID=403957 RepID=UPI0004D177CF|nr:DUF4959 domain-containing protein [Virgibacillus sp. SK37]AIF45727.1 hypothetical protein X953_19825 [Virgibacillus sp. SK37]
MKKIKITLIMTLLLVFVIPFGSVFASTNKDVFDSPYIESNTLDRNIYDNDESTHYRVGNGSTYNARVTFKKPLAITGFASVISSYDNFSLLLEFSDGTSYNMGKGSNNKIFDSPYLDVVSIDITLTSFNTSSIKDYSEIREMEILYEGTPPADTTPPLNIENFNYDASETTINFSYDLPKDEDLSHINVYVNGEVYKVTGNNYTLKGLESNNEYEVTFKSVDITGNESDGVTVTARTKEPPPPDKDGDGIPDSEDKYPDDPTNTPPPPKEVVDLKVNATDERVDLTWKKPKEHFEKAKVYRKALGSKETAFNLNPFAPMKVHAATDYKPLFETNGTEFSDLSVEPEKEYSYKVTSVYEGQESPGVTIQTATPPPPMIDMSEIELPFGIGALIESGNGLIALVGGFILLALSFVLVPKVIKLIRESVGKGKGSNKEDKLQQKLMKQQQEKEARQPRITEARAREIKPPRESRGLRIPRETNKPIRESVRAPRMTREPRQGRG